MILIYIHNGNFLSPCSCFKSCKRSCFAHDPVAVTLSTCRSHHPDCNHRADSLCPQPCHGRSSGAGPRRREGPRTGWAPGQKYMEKSFARFYRINTSVWLHLEERPGAKLTVQEQNKYSQGSRDNMTRNRKEYLHLRQEMVECLLLTFQLPLISRGGIKYQ